MRSLTKLACSCTVILLACTAARAANADWSSVTRQPVGQKITVKVTGGRTLEGCLVRADETGVTLETKNGGLTVARQDVRAVSVGRAHGKKLLAVGIGAGLAAGLALGLATIESQTYTYCPPGSTGACRSEAFPKQGWKNQLATSAGVAGGFVPFYLLSRPKTVYQAPGR